MAGGVTGAALSALLGVAGVLPSTSRPPAPPAPSPAGSPADAFLAAWRAHLSASWSVDEVDERTTDSGATIRYDIHDAQRPPDSLETSGGTVAARRGGVVLACGPAPSGTGLVCRSVPAPRTWQQDVDQQISNLAAAVTGPRAVFRVSAAGPGCWTLTLALPATVVPVQLGRGAGYCLDPTTWALRSSLVRRVGAVDRATTVASHAPATDADLALPPGATITPG